MSEPMVSCPTCRKTAWEHWPHSCHDASTINDTPQTPTADDTNNARDQVR